VTIEWRAQQGAGRICPAFGTFTTCFMEACTHGCSKQAVAEARWPWPRFTAADLDRALTRSAPTYHQWTDDEIRRLWEWVRDQPAYTWRDRVRYTLTWRPRWVMRAWRWRP
jgi:hypothetical protein